MTAFDVEEIIKKTGPDLLRELLRVYPVAEVDDYYTWNGWRNDLMKADLQIIFNHREEAGAPDPIALEDVKMPELPKVSTNYLAAQAQALQKQAQGKGVWVAAKSAGIQGASVVTAAAGFAKAASAAMNGGACAELRLMALFVAKWKLDPTRTKAMLAKVQPEKRRQIIQNFKTTALGLSVTDDLEKFVASSKDDFTSVLVSQAAKPKSASTGTMAKSAPIVVPSKVPPPLPPKSAGVKRPLEAGLLTGTALFQPAPKKPASVPAATPKGFPAAATPKGFSKAAPW